MTKVNKVLNSPEVLRSKKFHQVAISQKNQNGVYVPIVEGSLQEGVSITYDPQYSTLGEMLPGTEIITALQNNAVAIAGAQVFSATTQKQYTGASYIDLTVNIRVLDENGYGRPLKVASLLGALCQPLPFTKDLLEKYETKLTEFYEDIKKEGGEAFEKILDSDYKGLYKKGGELLDAAQKTLDASALRVVKLSISDYLELDEMVITNVSQSFSYEQSIAGPLYADFAIQLSTLKVPDSSKVLGYISEKVERVTIE